MSIIYIISLITLFASFVVLKKSDKKLDFVCWFAISIVILLSYNTFICYLYTLISIPINLLTLSIINFLISTIFIIFIIKGKRQIYEFKKFDLLFITLILIVTVFISLKYFGSPLEIKYIMTDSGVHYNTVHNFYKSDALLIKYGNEMMPGAYSNAGILLKVMSPVFDDIDLFKVYICFDIFMYFMTGLLMYVALKKIMNVISYWPIALFIIIIYIIGYPLNVLIYGFFYLQLGIIIFSTILILIKYFNDKIIYSKFMLLFLFLLCFELFFSYYLFVPVVYGALGIYYIYYFRKKNNKLFNKEMFIYISLTLVIPCVIGVIYNILPSLINPKDINVIDLLAMEGYIYRNYITNILLFVPFVLFYIIQIIKEKKFDFNILILALLILFMCLLYVGCSYKVVSTYYFYKTYFIMWFLILYLFGFSSHNIIENEKKGNIIVYAFIIVYILLLLISLCFQKVEISKKYGTNETLSDVMDIYGINKTIILDTEFNLKTEELEILKYIENDIEFDENVNFMFLVDPVQEYWIWGMFNYKNRDNLETNVNNEEIKKCNTGEKYDYIVYFNRAKRFNYYKEHIDLNKTILYENESGGVLKNARE